MKPCHPKNNEHENIWDKKKCLDCGNYYSAERQENDMKDGLDYDKLSRETRILFKEWLAKLTDADIDKIVGVPPRPKPKSLAEKLREGCVWTFDEGVNAVNSRPDWDRLANIAEQHFKESK